MEETVSSSEDPGNVAPVPPEAGANASPAEVGPHIAILGPAHSGKTLLVSALRNDQSLVEELKKPKPNPALDIEIDAPFFAAINPAIGEEPSSKPTLKEAYYSIPSAEEDDVNATTETVEHRFTLHWGDPKGVAPEDRPQERLELLAMSEDPNNDDEVSVELEYQSQVFSLFDGGGGGLTEDRPEDDPLYEKAEEYKARIKDAQGLIVCASTNTDVDYENSDVNEIEFLLQGIHEFMEHNDKQGRHPGPLQHVAVCFTKADTRFLDLGNAAYTKIIDPDESIKRMPARAYRDLLQVLYNLRMRFNVAVRIFPVSTFGFVNGNGAANYYPHEGKPGLLTRTIEKSELDKSDGTEHLERKWRDHFPQPITSEKTTNLWRPFNVAPALFFAATGRMTGVMSYSIEELRHEHGLT